MTVHIRSESDRNQCLTRETEMSKMLLKRPFLVSAVILVSLMVAFGIGAARGRGAGPTSNGDVRADSISAKSITLRDKDDRLLMSLGASAFDEPNILLYDKQGKPKLSVGLDSDGNGTVMFLDAKAKMRLTLGHTENAFTSLDLRDSSGKVTVELKVNSTGGGEIILNGEQLRR